METITITHKIEDRLISITSWEIVGYNHEFDNEGEMKLVSIYGEDSHLVYIVSGYSFDDAISNINDQYCMSPDSILFSSSERVM